MLHVVRLLVWIWMRASQAIDGLGLPGNAVLIVIVVAAGLYLLKLAAVSGMPSTVTMQPASVDDYPDTDTNTLEQATAELTALGFQPALDYTPDFGPTPTTTRRIARLFLHPGNRCYAEISQVFPMNREPRPMGTMIASELGSGWRLSTTNRPANADLCLMRRAKSVWSSHPGASAAELLQIHLDWRRQMLADLALTPPRDVSLSDYADRLKAEAVEQREAVRHKLFVLLWLELAWFSIRPCSRWLGGYHPRFGFSLPGA